MINGRKLSKMKKSKGGFGICNNKEQINNKLHKIKYFLNNK